MLWPYKELEHLERLHSEIPPAAPWLPTLMIHIRSQVKTRQVKVIYFKKLPKIQILKFCKKVYLRHTFWSCLIRWINMEWIQPNCRRYRADTECGTDGRMEWNQYTPQQLCCAGGIIKQPPRWWGRTDRQTDAWKADIVTMRVPYSHVWPRVKHINGLVLDCSVSSVLAMEILQSCTVPSIFF